MEKTYYFNSQNGTSTWTNPDKMVDGNNTINYADITNGTFIQVNNANTSSDIGGTIDKVEFRVVYGCSVTSDTLYCFPVFNGITEGSSYAIGIGSSPSAAGVGPRTGQWKNITNDGQAPGTWTWADIIALDLKLSGTSSSGEFMYVYQVDLQVTYTETPTPPPSPPPSPAAEDERTYIRFPTIDIEQNSTINSALVRFTAYEDGSGDLSVDCYFENSTNTTAPSSKSELTSLPLTGSTVWNINEAWIEGETYDSPEVGDILQIIISKDAWISGNAVTFIMDDSGESEYRKFRAEDYLDGSYKAQLIIESTPPIRVASPIISPITGTYGGIQPITITCTTPGSSIYYTTDGSTPDNTDTLYSSAIYLPADMTVKAIVYNDNTGYSTSLVKTNTYKLNCDDSGMAWDSGVSSETVARNNSATIAITDSTGLGAPYSWSVSGTGFTPDNSSTVGLTNKINADNTSCGSATITVTGCDGTTITGYIRCTTGKWVAKAWCNRSGLATTVKCTALNQTVTTGKTKIDLSYACKYYQEGCPGSWDAWFSANPVDYPCTVNSASYENYISCSSPTPPSDYRCCYIRTANFSEWECS